MSGSFDTDIPALRSVSSSAKRIADAVQALGGTVDLSGVTAGMPSSRSAPRAVALQSEWRADLGAWARDTHQYANDVISSADAYGSTDDRSAAHLRRAGGGR